jgi:hypothetical protein
MSRTLLTLALLSAPVMLTSVARADLITWGPSQNATAATDVSLNGTLVTARNPWAMTFAQPTVNGVTFIAFSPLGWDNGGWTLMNGSMSGDAGLDALLDSARVTSDPNLGNPTGWGGIRLDTLGTLTIGSTYEIQVWYCDQRPGVPTNVLNDRVMTLSSATGAATLTLGTVTNLAALAQGPLSGGLEADPNNVSGAGDTIFGQFAIGTFTRTSTDQLWLLVQGSHPLANNVLAPHINAFQIREVPSSTGTVFCSGDGTATACPCGNLGASGNGCANSVDPMGGHLTASGSSSLAGDTLVLGGSGMPSSSALYFQGTTQLNGGLGAVFGDGLRCAGGTIIRLGTKTNVAGTSQYPGAGNPSVSVRGMVTAPGTRTYQVWYRNAASFCTISTFNLTNGLEITWM